MENKKKILIDTDIGDDMDDAFALLSAMALDFEIVGITTVFRDTVARARMVKKLLRGFGCGYETVPVYAGYASYTRKKETNNENLCAFGRELDLPALTPENTDPEEAVEFILDSCRRYGKDLIILPIGPFCNIAKACEKDPDALNAAGQVVIMGGAYYKQYADWNVMCDVPAADVMFRELRNLHCIGADVTHRLEADDFLMDALRAEGGNEAFRYIRTQYRLWQADHPREKLVLHDVLTVYYSLDPKICTMERIRIKLLTEGFAKGMTLNVNAYSKAGLNCAYTPGIFLPEILASRDVDLEKFHRFVRQDILRCMDGNPS